MDNNFELTQGQRLDRAYKKEKGSIFGFFIKNYRFTYLILISIVAMGFFALFSLPREANPEIKVPFAVVNTFLPGGSPEDVEDLLTNKIEDKIKNVEDLKQFDSTSGNGLSSIFVEFVAEADLQQSFQKLREAVDRAGPELPSEAEAPVVTEIRFNDFAIVTYSLVGDCSREILESCTDNLKSALEDVDGVSKVEVVGKPDREFQIIVDQSKLASFNLSISQIAGAIRSANITLPVGDIEVDQFNYNVRIKGKISRIEDLRQIVVANLGGSPVYLSDIGQVIDGEEEENTLSRIGTSGERSAESVSLMVYKKTGGNIIKIIEATDERIETLKASGGIAEELKIIQSNDNSVFIKEDLKLTPAGKKEFNILRVPNPTPVLNGYAGGEIRQTKLKDMDSVYVDMDWFYYRDILFQVTSFEIIIQKTDNTSTSYQHKGTQLSQEVKEVIYELEAGSVIIVSRIFADIATKGNRQLPGSIVLSVIE